jgi:hypothetical protein
MAKCKISYKVILLFLLLNNNMLGQYLTVSPVLANVSLGTAEIGKHSEANITLNNIASHGGPIRVSIAATMSVGTTSGIAFAVYSSNNTQITSIDIPKGSTVVKIRFTPVVTGYVTGQVKFSCDVNVYTFNVGGIGVAPPSLPVKQKLQMLMGDK